VELDTIQEITYYAGKGINLTRTMIDGMVKFQKKFGEENLFVSIGAFRSLELILYNNIKPFYHY